MSSWFPNYFCTTLPSGSPVTSGTDYCQEFLDSLPFYALPENHSNLSKMQGLAVCIQSLYYSQREARSFGPICEAPGSALLCGCSSYHLSFSDVHGRELIVLSLQITLFIKIFVVQPMLTRFLSFPSIYYLGLYQVSFFPPPPP